MSKLEWKEFIILANDFNLTDVVLNEQITQQMEYTKAHRILMTAYDNKYNKEK